MTRHTATALKRPPLTEPSSSRDQIRLAEDAEREPLPKLVSASYLGIHKKSSRPGPGAESPSLFFCFPQVTPSQTPAQSHKNPSYKKKGDAEGGEKKSCCPCTGATASKLAAHREWPTVLSCAALRCTAKPRADPAKGAAAVDSNKMGCAALHMPWAVPNGIPAVRRVGRIARGTSRAFLFDACSQWANHLRYKLRLLDETLVKK